MRTLECLAADASAPVPHLSVAVDAPSGQRWVDKNFNAIVGPFQKELRANGFSDRVLYFEAGSGRVIVGLNRSVGGSILGIEEKAAFVASQVLSHARDKENKLRHTSASNFLLIYLRRPHTGGADFDGHTMAKVFDFLGGMSELPNSLSGVLFVNYEQKDITTPDSLLWDRAGKLAGYFGTAVDRIHVVKASLMPKQHQELARAIPRADIEATGMIMVGSCDLRGPGCSARGTSGSIFSYSYAGRQFGACHECIKTFEWPSLSHNGQLGQ
jgi:hypothetical protein